MLLGHLLIAHHPPQVVGRRGLPKGGLWRAEWEQEMRVVQIGPLQWPGGPPAPTGGWLPGDQSRV